MVSGVALPGFATPSQEAPLGGDVESVKPTAAPPLALRLTVCDWADEPAAALKLSETGAAVMEACSVTVNVTGIVKGWVLFEGET
jgi:hypothetical protein